LLLTDGYKRKVTRSQVIRKPASRSEVKILPVSSSPVDSPTNPPKPKNADPPIHVVPVAKVAPVRPAPVSLTEPLQRELNHLREVFRNARKTDEFAAVAENALQLADQAIANGKPELVSVIGVLALSAARNSEYDELTNLATLCVLGKRKPSKATLILDATPPLSPPPSDAAQEKALLLIQQLFQADYKKAKTIEGKEALAKKMLEKASATKEEPVNTFVLLKIASENGDVETALEAVDQMACLFTIDEFAMKVAILAKCAKAARLPEQRTSVMEQALPVIDDAVAEDKFDVAKQVGELALTCARPGIKDVELVKKLRLRLKENEELAKAYKGVQLAMETLKDKPTDPDANLAVGRYLCLVKGDWKQGVSFLALGSDKTLKALAVNELEGATDAAEQVKLADGLWDTAQAESGMAKMQLQRRAVHWYRRALPWLPGPAKDKVERRLKEADGPASKKRR
jgi:hypothetical protein